MGRRSYGISMTQINRMISASNAEKQARERQNLINSQKGICCEREPEYSIYGFDFNKESRVAHVEFLEKKFYRKILKYVTQDGQRYPIYSDWLFRTKKIKKTIKLTNENLETLNHNPDRLISYFSYNIIARIESEDFYPSWFIIRTLKNEEQSEINEIARKYENKNHNENIKINKIESNIKNNNDKKSELTSKLRIYEKKQNRISRAIISAKNKKHMLFFSIISFGIYSLFHSEKRILELNNKLENIVNIILNIQNEISLIDINIVEMSKQIEDIKKIIENNVLNKKNEISKVKVQYTEKISLVESLPATLNDSLQNDFVPLKKLVGMNYEKIIGCYVIRNVEKNKYYVGQSKDVLKRVCKQHFDGTNVKNIIFAEDYYCSQLENKDNLFEVRIIRLNTKDEMDQKEKELIEEYDSFNNGYNGTNGNN